MSVEQRAGGLEIQAAEVVRLARQADVRLVRFLYCDNSGIIRGKAAHLDTLLDRMAAGLGLPVEAQAMNLLDQPQPVDGFQAVGEVRLVPDPSTFVLVPYAAHVAAMIADMVRLDHQPWEACPRRFLKRQIEAGLAEGLQLQAAFEPEWSLAVRQGDLYVPFDESMGFSGVGMSTAAQVIDEIVLALEAQNLQVEQYHPEHGHGQQELSIRHAPALRAADNHLLYRETVRGVVYKQGFFASFAPKPWPNQAGNGCHIHFSVWDPTGEQNLFYGEGRRHGLSEFAEHFLAGVLEHLAALVALTCPSYNSYQRLQPGLRSSAYVSYGPDNREAAVRIASPFWGKEMRSFNLELKAADSSSNPYIALGGLLAAGLDGVRRELPLDRARCLEVDPASLSPEERESRGISRLPETLEAAIRELEEDRVLLDAMGDDLSRAYLAVRRSEWETFSQESSQFQHRGHFWKY